jgi:acetylornithine deacetylase
MGTPGLPGNPDVAVEGVVPLLAEMVAVDTVNAAMSGRPRAEQALVELLHDRAATFGLEARRLPVPRRADDLLLTCEKDPGSAWLLFECHLDTVGVEDVAGDPFEARVSDRRLHGRGACDAKGAGAAMLIALAAHAARPDGTDNVALLFSVDEEVTRTGIDAFVARHLPALGWRPAAAVVGEPTGLGLVVAHNGGVRLTIATEGRAAHSSDPARGRSAIAQMLPVLEVLERRYLPGITSGHPLTGPARGSVNLIRGGSAINVVPASCQLGLDRRIAPGEDPAAVVADIERLLDELRREHPDLVVRMGEPVIHPALDPRFGAPLAAHVGTILSSLGLSDRVSGVGYGTHASTLSSVAGIPSVVLGPGRIEQAHSADEWVDLDELESAVDVYGALMLAGAPRERPPGRGPGV